MKKTSGLFMIIVIFLVYFLFTNCGVSAINIIPFKAYHERDSISINEKNDSLNLLIVDYINSSDMEIDSLNSLLSQVSKKNKIEVTGWKTKYNDCGLSYNTYVGYRLARLYGFKLEDITDEESRLNFFIASVRISDYEILDLLNFQDSALDMNSCYGETVLTVAVRQNNAKMIRYLLNHGVDKSKREFAACYDDAKEGQNASEIAKDLGYNEIIDLLK